MKKYFLAVFLSIVSLSSCSKDNPISSTSGACDQALAIRRNAFVLDGNGYTNVSFNFDTIPSSRMVELQTAKGAFTYTDHLFSLGSTDTSVNIFLLLHMSNIASGSYSWSDRSHDMNAMGCTLILSKGDGSSSHSYNSISGGTSILLFQSTPIVWDSIFGSYCGTLKDSLGNTITITKGMFSITH
jgi:hypothetical protein